MLSYPFIFTPAERVALETILGSGRRSWPPSRRLTPVLDDLAQTCDGLLATRRRLGIFLPASRPSSSTGRWTRRAPGAVTRIGPRLQGVTAVGILLTHPVPVPPPNLEGLARSSLKAEIKRYQEQGWIE